MASLTVFDEGTKQERTKVTYECKTLDGSRKRKSKTFPPGTSPREIKAFRRKVEEEYENGKAMDFKRRTITDLVEDYFEMYAQHLSPSTARSYRQMAWSKKHGIVKNFGNVEVKKLDCVMIQRFVNTLMKEVSAKTVKNYVTFLHTLYDKAIKMHYVSGVNIVSEVELPKIKKKKYEAYSLEEVRTLLQVVDTYACERLRLQVYTGLFTGMRRSEIACLEIEDIDFENNVIHVTKSKISLGGTMPDVEKDTKTSAGVRDIPLAPVLAKEFKRAIKKYNENKLKHGALFEDSRKIFSNEFGKPYKTDTFSSAYRTFMLKHTDEIRFLSFHSLRHTFASLSIAQGMDIKALQEILGHQDCAVTLNIYSNSYSSVKQEYVEKLGNAILEKRA